MLIEGEEIFLRLLFINVINNDHKTFAAHKVLSHPPSCELSITTALTSQMRKLRSEGFG